MQMKLYIQAYYKFNPFLSNCIRSHFGPLLNSPNFASFCTTRERFNKNLMEFFEDKKNWGKDEIRSGRSWKTDELRIKSNEDLHKLWYILLKEKNMLLTMEHFYKENYILFPSPERIDKVEESMKNLETVVRERNKAYYMLETGEDGERPGVMVHNAIGLPMYHKQEQHDIPKYENIQWKKNNVHEFDYEECREFLKLYREKIRKEDNYRRKKNNRYVKGLLKRFKNVDIDYLKEIYPDVNVDQYKNHDFQIGHWEV